MKNTLARGLAKQQRFYARWLSEPDTDRKNPEADGMLARYNAALSHVRRQMASFTMPMTFTIYAQYHQVVLIVGSIVDCHDREGEKVNISFRITINQWVCPEDFVSIATAFVGAIWRHELDEALHVDGKRVREPHPVVNGVREASTIWDMGDLHPSLKACIK